MRACVHTSLRACTFLSTRECVVRAGFHLQQLLRQELVGAAQCVYVGEQTDPVAWWQLRYAPVLPLPPIPTYAHSHLRPFPLTPIPTYAHSHLRPFPLTPIPTRVHSPFRPFPLGASGHSPRMHLEAGRGGAGRGGAGRDVMTSLDVTAAASSASSGGG